MITGIFAEAPNSFQTSIILVGMRVKPAMERNVIRVTNLGINRRSIQQVAEYES